MAESRREAIRRWLRYLLAAAFALAGIAHLRTPATFLAITPGWVPMPAQVIALTGVCELLGAAALLMPGRLRWWGGTMLALYTVCVYPANINHALNDIAVGGTHLGWWYHGPRLLFQPVIAWWCLFAGHVIDWPARQTR